MIWAGIIQDLAYERGGQKLFVLFDSQRRVLFHHVPEDLWAQLSNPATRDSVLALNILGQFAWSDLGIRLPDAADSSR